MINLIDKISSEEFSRFLLYLNKSVSFTVSGLNTFYKLLLISFIQKYKKVLFITDKEQKALRYKSDLEKFFQIFSDFIPSQESSPYDCVNANFYRYKDEIKFLQNQGSVVITTVKTLCEKFPDKTFFDENKITFEVNKDIDLNNIVKKLSEFGYKKATVVTDIGEFSLRGDILDIYSLDDKPVRIELWGDTVTDIRLFDNETQRSIEKLKSYSVNPVFKFVLSDKKIDDFKKEFADFPQLTEKIENEKYFDGIDYFQTFFNDNLKILSEFFDNEYFIILDESSEIFAKFDLLEKNFEKKYQEATDTLDMPALIKSDYVKLDEFQKSLLSKNIIKFDNFISGNDEFLIELNSSLPPVFSSSVEEIASYIDENMKSGYKLAIATEYPKRVIEILKEFEIIYSYNFGDNGVFITSPLSVGGAVLDDFKMIILTDKELFNKKSKYISATKYAYYKENQEYIDSVNDIQPGDYVVHKIHGIGLYKGLTQQEIDGELKDYLTIEYAKSDKLHIPAEQINFLFRYRGTNNIQPKLSRMGGNDWNIIKGRVKKAVEDVAKDLINLYARRQLAKGIRFDEDTSWQYEMEDAFEYVETPDQLKSINEIKADMESDKPMDRLVCGDVGFGKTEVAMRAVFKAIMSGKQVAVVAPTTILAYQHFQTMKERFAPFPIQIDLLSRYKTPKEQKETINKLISNECNLVIGTHRLLQKDVQFKDLGLLVIDEEHRFGVKDKERLKMLKKNIDIITMSATPIPRTLYMSLSGIKDMSVINTPPTNRLPIKTFVGVFNENYLKNAINYEMDRDGQVFYLYNRVETIFEFASQLKKIVPNANIAVAHGKMEQKLLEQVMFDFQEHKFDILVCTTIIESGLDIPNANTIIIHDADRFGLAQLYQLRGRVGRSERQAYCYCFYDKNKILTKEAMQRLTAIKDFTTLGSGYQIALRDIEIRGVGNILGTKQHGNMVNVGFDTYCELLDEAVQELKGEKEEEKVQTIIDINVTAYISDEWVGSKEQKMIEYKRLADVDSVSKVDLIYQEWKDRFAKCPEEVENLIKLVKLRILASEAKITLVRQTDENVRLYMPYTNLEWRLIVKNLSPNITKYLKYTDAPKTCNDAKSIILLKNKYISFDETFVLLSELFYGIVKVINEYNKSQ